eukprot:CAMPEP_0113601244 /NCGR_PEP_ID=MMETSP0017_2-20120614/126_1 /TAXON_ID=2856 /ORGANISM="Cylindrotheca closterium" /LENGTH=157 /DNA_ID=CAMNT_0000509525 /DNA_START=33 /DNA_END=503 /DNA_ORIENTATION=+ /assembly_acc=CAM_ASM_000147
MELKLEKMVLLGGLTAADLFDSLNIVLITWLLMIFLPQWRWTPTLTLVTPILQSLLYALGIFSMILFPQDPDAAQLDFFSLEGVVTGFSNHNIVFVGWVHYFVSDALVGRMVLLDSLSRNASTKFHIFGVVPSLFFCCMLGPVGFGLYMILRSIFLP